jgi:lysophospholipase L1-like esterase
VSRRHGRRSAVTALGLLALIGCAWWGPTAPTSLAHRRPGDTDVLALGDSVPAGAACDCRPFPELYARDLAANGRSTNLARSGFTSGDVLEQVEDPATESAVRAASVIVIMVGANDLAPVFAAGGSSAACRRAAAVVQLNVTAVLRRIRAVQPALVPVLVLGYWNVVEDGDVASTDYSAADTAQAAAITGYTNDALRSAAVTGSATYVSTLAAFKGDDGRANPTGLLAGDGDHPDAQGQLAIAAALYAAQPTVTR